MLFSPHFAFSVSILRFGYQWKQARPFQCNTCKKVLVSVISPNTTERFTLFHFALKLKEFNSVSSRRLKSSQVDFVRRTQVDSSRVDFYTQVDLS